MSKRTVVERCWICMGWGHTAFSYVDTTCTKCGGTGWVVKEIDERPIFPESEAPNDA